MEDFPIYSDIKSIDGKNFINSFDVLCGGFPCQAFSTAARGKNIKEKDLWPEMFNFIKSSSAPIVFAENVTLKAINKAKEDLAQLGYKTNVCKLSCDDLGGNHRRNRYWLMAVKDFNLLKEISNNLNNKEKLTSSTWSDEPYQTKDKTIVQRRKQLKAIGNAQSPLVAATAFRILANRLAKGDSSNTNITKEEFEQVFAQSSSWISKKYGENFLLHTPTTMANYSAPSMMKHQGCRNFVNVFSKPNPDNAEYLMGFPHGSSSPLPQDINIINNWLEGSYKAKLTKLKLKK